MKLNRLLIGAILLISMNVFGQNLTEYVSSFNGDTLYDIDTNFIYSGDTHGTWGIMDEKDDCGTWEADTIYTTLWETTFSLTDTIPSGTVWVYSEWEDVFNMQLTYAVYCPCGCGYDTKEYQKRATEIGIIQERWRITTYKYVPKPLTEFEKLERKLIENYEKD